MKNLSIFFFVVLLTQLSFSQTMNVYTKSAPTAPTSFQLSQIDSITFQTTPTPPPTLTSPTATAATNILTNSFIANWSSVSGATGYKLDVATDNGFTTFVTGFNNIDVSNVTTYNVTGLTASTTYYYRVRAYNASSTSTSSNTITVVTQGPQPTLLTYDDGSYEYTLQAQSSYYYILVRFDRPSGWTNFNVTKIRMNLATDASVDSIKLLCYNTQLGSSGNYYPYQNLFASTNSYDPQTGWNEYTVNWPLSIDKFCVGYLQLGSTSPSVKCDTSLPHNMRSCVVYLSGSTLTAALVSNANFAIQVYVQQSTGSPLIEPNGMWLNGVISKNDLLKKGLLQDTPGIINYEAIPLGKLQNNLK